MPKSMIPDIEGVGEGVPSRYKPGASLTETDRENTDSVGRDE
jgi:hypothetical protein